MIILRSFSTILFYILEMSRELQSIFVNPVALQHPGGHYLAASSPQKAVYQEFFKDMLLRTESDSQKNEVTIL